MTAQFKDSHEQLEYRSVDKMELQSSSSYSESTLESDSKLNVASESVDRSRNKLYETNVERDAIEDLNEQFRRLHVHLPSSFSDDHPSNTEDASKILPNQERQAPAVDAKSIEAFDQTMRHARIGMPIDVLSLASRDVCLLNHGEWLNDEIVNAFMKLLQEHNATRCYPKCHFFNSFFLPQLSRSDSYDAIKRWTQPKRLKRWGQRCVTILDCHLIFFPCFAFSHWSLIVADLRNHTLVHYDSMRDTFQIGQIADHVRSKMSCIQDFLSEEARDKMPKDWRDGPFEFRAATDAPQQLNGSDCGVFLVQYAKYLSLNRPLTFTQSHMHDFRIQMLMELRLQKILE